MIEPYSYDVAYSRNLGWTTEWEQTTLRAKRVAIAGLGGVGGAHLLTLSRLGIGSFSIADFDTFDLANLNRQAGAYISTIGRPKVDVLAEMALDINPELRLDRHPAGVMPDVIDAFLDGCDLFVDGLDFFALDIRAQVFARCDALGIPAVTAAPIGMGVGFLAFRPGGQSFEQYFRLEGHSRQEQYLRFLMGVAPAGLHRAYLVDDTRVNLAAQRGPSTAAACELCAGVVATQALKILLGRGEVPYAPLHVTFDAYRSRISKTRLRWGNAGPLQRVKLTFARRIYARMAEKVSPAAPVPGPTSVLHRILDAARWAPSGDNTQPWRFEVLADDCVLIHVASEAETNPYEYRDGEPGLLAAGMLLESLRIAASVYGRGLDWSVRDEQPLLIQASFPNRKGITVSPLLAALTMRTVERRTMTSGRLSATDKHALEAALGPGLRVVWRESLGQRIAISRLGAIATDIRLRAPETFKVHRKVVDWSSRFSPVGLPAGAIGLTRPTLMMMQWAMSSWDRMHRMNSILGTAGAAIQLDLLPGLRSAAYFAICFDGQRDGRGLPELLKMGESLQRFWLTAAVRGLALQPALATLIFADYGMKDTQFTAAPRLRVRATTLAKQLTRRLAPVETIHFMGRIGRRRDGLPGPRSVRRTVAELIVAPAAEAPLDC